MPVAVFCTRCGNRLENIPVCTRCGERSEYWDVEAPEMVTGGAEEEIEVVPVSLPSSRWDVGVRSLSLSGLVQEISEASSHEGLTPGPESDEEMERNVTGESKLSTAELTAGGGGRPSPIARLVRASSPGHGETHLLREGENLVGRGRENDVILADGAISRVHARIVCRWVDGALRCQVMDLGSENGTYVDGRKVRVCEAQPGASICFGSVLFHLRRESRERSERQRPSE